MMIIYNNDSFIGKISEDKFCSESYANRHTSNRKILWIKIIDNVTVEYQMLNFVSLKKIKPTYTI
jgi:hypothetical protein